MADPGIFADELQGSVMASKNEIFTVVQRCLARSLVQELGKIVLESRLIDDLGADSLDFVDIVFELERQFGIKLKGAELDSLLRADVVAERPNERGFVPRAEIDRLTEWLPSLREAPDPDRIAPYQLFSYITTESLVLLVQRRFDAQPNQAARS